MLALAAVVAALAATVSARASWAHGNGPLGVGRAPGRDPRCSAVSRRLEILPADQSSRSRCVVGALLALPLVFAAITAAAASAWWLFVIWPMTVVLFFVAAKRFGGRSVAAVDALERTLFAGTVARTAQRRSRAGRCTTCSAPPTSGRATTSTCRTASRWGFPAISGPPGANTLADAVQASACLPGAFLARTTNVLGGDPAGEVVVSDGGVYDNMADQWEWGFPNRVKYAQAQVPGGPELLATAQPAAATHLVVVNASARHGGHQRQDHPAGPQGRDRQRPRRQGRPLRRLDRHPPPPAGRDVRPGPARPRRRARRDAGPHRHQPLRHRRVVRSVQRRPR